MSHRFFWPTRIAACVLVLSVPLTALAVEIGDERLAVESSAAVPATANQAEQKPQVRFKAVDQDAESVIESLLTAMTLEEKIGQMCQVVPTDPALTDQMREAIAAGRVGSIINAPSAAYIEESQRIAQQESRLGIPLLIGRDVIHGFRTVFPIPLGQAASWNPELVEQAAAVAAMEAASQGINWTFAPMVDVSRDPRWGRIAESLGEDPVLASSLAVAMVRGFQQEQEGRLQGVAACVKHFAAYGLGEGGRDYNRASLSIADLHNVYLPPFKASIEAGCRTLMTSFNEVNGVPGTANELLLRRVLRDEWGFTGLVVSDWNSVIEMIAHGFSRDGADAARQAVAAGVDMEMVSPTFQENLADLVASGALDEAQIDEAVRHILRVKMLLSPGKKGSTASALKRPRSLQLARKLAQQSLVLLKNEQRTLPLDADRLMRIAVIGELADAPRAQLGCWIPDGDAEDSITPLEAIRDYVGDRVEVSYAKGAAANFSKDESGVTAAVQAAEQADVVLLFVGEDSLLSGEAHSRATLDLPGAQRTLVQAVAKAGKPTVMVVMAGRPLAIGDDCAAADAVLYAWHPGTMGGPAIAEVLFGAANPSGKLPVTLPKSVGQVPLYYGHPNTGRPSPANYRPKDFADGTNLPAELHFKSHYVDSDPLPLFPFGYGLSYAAFNYDGLELSTEKMLPGQTLGVRVRVTNAGERAGTEVVQVYARDLVGSLVRPVKELKAFRRVYLRPGESEALEFALHADDLAYYNNEGKSVLEPGRFMVWVGGDSSAELGREFELAEDDASFSDPAPVVDSDSSNSATNKNERAGARRAKQSVKAGVGT